MDISKNGVEFIASHEGFSATAYKGEGETYWTIGYGHYGPDVSPGDTITKAEALDLLYSDLVSFVSYTNDIALSKFPNLNQNQFDALVSYCYNRGPGNSAGTNGLRQLIYNSNTIAEISANFLVYWGTNTNYYEGLMNRRRAEKALFDSGYSGGDNEEEKPSIHKHKMSLLMLILATQRR